MANECLTLLSLVLFQKDISVAIPSMINEFACGHTQRIQLSCYSLVARGHTQRIQLSCYSLVVRGHTQRIQLSNVLTDKHKFY